MTLVRLTGLPRRGRVVGELQADRQRGLLEVLRQRRERLGLGDGPDRRLVVVLVTGALGDDDALELTVARDLEDHRRLLAGQRVAVPLFFDLPVDHGDVHAYGKSVMSSVSAPTPWGEPPIWPSGGAGGGAAGVGAAARAVVTVGSSLSLGRGSPGARGGRPGSGRPGDGSRAGRSRAGRSREGSRWGRSVGVGRGGGSCSGCWRPCGTPTAAMAGTRLTMTGLGSLPPHTALPQSTAAPKAAWKMTETSVDLTGSRSRRRAGPRWRRPRSPMEAVAARRQRSRAGSVTIPSRSIPARRTRSMVSITAP